MPLPKGGPETPSGELRDYERAIGKPHFRMQLIVDAFDDEAAIPVVDVISRQPGPSLALWEP